MNRRLDSEEYFRQSTGLHDTCQYDKSILCCKRALTARSNFYDGHFQWARNLIKKEAYKKAVKKHQEVISRDPMHSSAYFNLGVTFERCDRFSDAEVQYKKSLEVNSSYHDASYNLAIVLTMQGKYTEALEQYEKNIIDNPNDSSTYNCYGYLKFTFGRYEEAIEGFENAIRKDPEYSMPFINKSLALYCLERTELAKEAFKESLCKLNALNKVCQIYRKELSRFEKLVESDGLGEFNKEKLEINIKGLKFIVDLLNQESTKFLNKEE